MPVFRDDSIIVVYVDDCLIFSKDGTVLEGTLKHLGTDFCITSDENVGIYLGLDIKLKSAGYLEIVQPGLIDKVITTCDLDNECNEQKMPADSILHASKALDAPRQL